MQESQPKFQFPPTTSAASLAKRDASSMSLLSVSTSGSLQPPIQTDSCSVSPNTASAAMTLSNLEKNARNVPDRRAAFSGLERDTGESASTQMERRVTMETRGLATENESTRGSSDKLRGDIAAGIVTFCEYFFCTALNKSLLVVFMPVLLLLAHRCYVFTVNMYSCCCNGSCSV